MRLAFLYRRLAREGGTEGDLYRTLAELAQRGHEVHLFCADLRTTAPSGVSAHRVPVVRAGRLARLLSFAWVAPRVAAGAGSWDVVVGFGRTSCQDLIRCGGGTHRAYLDAMRASGNRNSRLGPYHRVVLALEARQYRPGAFRRVIAVSERVKREIASGYAVQPERIRILYNGVDSKRFDVKQRAVLRETVRRRFGLPVDDRVVLSVGSGFRRKGVDILLKLWSDDPPSDSWLVVVGADERIRTYRRAATRPPLNRCVVFTGPQAAVEGFYAAADAVVVASLQEAFGNVVLEALAAGLPVVTSTRVGAAELLGGPLRDLLVDDPRDVEALRGRLGLALGANWGDFSREARRVAEEHPWSEHFAGLESLLEETAAARA